MARQYAPDDHANSKPQRGAISQVDEYLIEVYVRYPDQLDPDLAGSIKKLIAGNHMARNIADFYKEFYLNFDALKTWSTPSLDRFISEKLSSCNESNEDLND